MYGKLILFTCSDPLKAMIVKGIKIVERVKLSEKTL